MKVVLQPRSTMMSPEAKRLVAQMEAEISTRGKRSLGLPDDWEYRDIPWCDTACWNRMIALLGEGEFRLIAHSRRPVGNNTEHRGQMFVSPKGLGNLKALISGGVH